MPVIVPTGQVFSHMLAVFATDDTGMLALLSSAPHYWWAISRASTMKGDLRYTPSDVFETLARPEMTTEMRELGGRLDTFRRELMLARQAGLTATYNLVHDQRCTDADIAELREIHRAIDEAVVRAYGWDDLLAAGLDHGFHDTRQGPRYTIGAVVRQEILDRLLELNHERYAAEVKAGLHDKRGRKRSTRPAIPPSSETGQRERGRPQTRERPSITMAETVRPGSRARLHLLGKHLPCVRGKSQPRPVRVLAVTDSHSRTSGPDLHAGSAVAAAITALAPHGVSHVHFSSATLLIKSRETAHGRASALSVSKERATMSRHRGAVRDLPLRRRLQVDHGRLAVKIRDHEVCEQSRVRASPGMTWIVTFGCSARSASRSS